MLPSVHTSLGKIPYAWGQGGVEPGLGFFHPTQTSYPCLFSERPTMADNNHVAAVTPHPDINDNVAVSGGGASGQPNPPTPGHVAHTVPMGNNRGGDGSTYF